MALATSFFIAFGLAMDSFAVSLGIGATGKANTLRPILRVCTYMGLFQGFLTLLGWLAGSSIAAFIAEFDHWVALALLAFVGMRMVRSGLDRCPGSPPSDASQGLPLIMICVATSIDALAVGVGLAMLDINIVQVSLFVGGVTLGLSLLGLLAGGQLGGHFGRRMEVLGGLLLMGIGLRIFVSHLL